MSATLGGLIKDYRLQKNISQIEIAFALGWSETSRLSRIEQGKVINPPREFIDRLTGVMKLNEEEKNYLLLVGSYLPTQSEINQIRTSVGAFIQTWPYPALVYDFSWRAIDENDISRQIYRINELYDHKKLLDNQITILDIVFNSKFIQNRDLTQDKLKKRRQFLKNMLSQYQYQQRTRTKEKWYVDRIKRLMSNKLFKELWQEIQHSPQVDMIGNYGYKSVPHPTNNQKYLNFYFFIESVFKDPRFQVELYVPSDAETFQYFAKNKLTKTSD